MKFKLGYLTVDVRWWNLAACLASAVTAFWWPSAILVLVAYVVLFMHEFEHARVLRSLGAISVEIKLFGVMRGTTTATLSRPITLDEMFLYHYAGPIAGIGLGLFTLGVVTLLRGAWWDYTGALAIILLHVWNLLPWKKGSDGAEIRAALRLIEKRKTP